MVSHLIPFTETETELQQWFQLKISIKELTLRLIKSYWQTKSSYVCIFIWESIRSTTKMIWTIKLSQFSSLFARLFKEDQVPQQKKAFLQKVISRFYLTRTSILDKQSSQSSSKSAHKLICATPLITCGFGDVILYFHLTSDLEQTSNQ